MKHNQRVLFIAFHTPPIQGSTGVTRTLSFAKFLKEFDWQATILTATPQAYTEVREENLKQVPSHVQIERARAWDTQRHFSLFGRYPWWLASPDRWQSWYWPAVLKGLRLIREQRPAAIVSTYPIATAHRIAATLAKWSGLPWIADFRDPMAQHDYPTDPRIHRAFSRIERKIFARASRVVVTTSGTAALYADRFPSYPREHIVLLPNGFDAEMFGAPLAVHASTGERPLTLLHSGLLYPSERDPTEFFAAVAELKQAGLLKSADVQFVFRAPQHEALYEPKLQSLGIGDLIKLLPPITDRDALAEMQSTDAFMLFQASNCNDQIPAKLYEYLYAQKPILALTDARGETARLMFSVGSDRIADIHDRRSIVETLPRFIAEVRKGEAPIPAHDRIAPFSRRNVTGRLADLLNDVVQESAVKSPSAVGR